MTVRRFSHLGICVSDLERSLAFYRDGLGFRELRRLEASGEATEQLLGLQEVDLQVVFLGRDGLVIELLRYASPPHRGSGDPRPMNALGLTHLSVAVDDLDATLAALEGVGARVLRATRVHNEALGAQAAFVADPDGTRIELVAAPDGVVPRA